VQVCPKCGHENFEDTDFCAQCGEYLRWDETEVVPPPETAVAPPPAPPPAPDPPPPPPPPPSPEPGPWPGQQPVAPPEPALPAEPVLVTLRLPGSEETGPPTVAVEAGGQALLSVLVRNQSDIVDTYQLAVEGLPAGWWSVEPPRVYLLPYGSQESGFEQEAQVRLHPPRAPDSSAGAWPLQLAAHSVSRADAVGRGAATVDVAPFLEVGATLRPEQAEGERGARYQLVLRNGGNREVSASLTAEDPELALGFEFRPPRLDVAAGGTQAAELAVSTRRAPTASPRQHRFVVTAAADGATAQATGVFVQPAAEKPVLKRRGGQLALRLLLTLLAALLLIGGSWATWAGDYKGFCQHSSSESCLDASKWIPKVGGEPPSGVAKVVSSAGFVTIVLGALAVLGLRKGRSTWLAGVLGIALLVLVGVEVHHINAGFAVPFLGAILALVAGFLPTVFKDT